MPAAGGAPLLGAAESARHTVSGRIESPERLDLQGYAAGLRVERVIAGDTALAGSLQRIAWEELAAERPVRFADGDRVLLALEALPSWSIWRERLGKRTALHVAARGAAFLRDPDAATQASLARFLSLDPEQRDAAAGAEALLELALSGQEPLGRAALARLSAVPGLALRLPDEAAPRLTAALRGADRNAAWKRALLQLAAERELQVLRPALDDWIPADAELRVDAAEAAAQLDGGLTEARVAALLAESQPGLRALALRHAPASQTPDPARAHLADPAPEVRAAAASGLIARRGLDAFDAVAPLLGDDVPSVRGAAAQGLGGLGPEAVARLAAWADTARGDAARGPLLALSTSPAGRQHLARLARSHPDEEARRLARFLLGRRLDPH